MNGEKMNAVLLTLASVGLLSLARRAGSPASYDYKWQPEQGWPGSHINLVNVARKLVAGKTVTIPSEADPSIRPWKLSLQTEEVGKGPDWIKYNRGEDKVKVTTDITYTPLLATPWGGIAGVHYVHYHRAGLTKEQLITDVAVSLQSTLLEQRKFLRYRGLI